MKYWYIFFENNEYWIETDYQDIALRQIIKNSTGEVQISCFEDCLAEGKFDANEMDGLVQEISKENFEREWVEKTEKYRKKWIEQKYRHPLGTKIKGNILYFYPQGCIVKIKDALGICLTEEHERNMTNNLAEIINGIVKGYDEVNMWIIVSQA